jgi:hypothetical protein
MNHDRCGVTISFEQDAFGLLEETFRPQIRWCQKKNHQRNDSDFKPPTLNAPFKSTPDPMVIHENRKARKSEKGERIEATETWQPRPRLQGE